MDTLYTFAIRI